MFLLGWKAGVGILFSIVFARVCNRKKVFLLAPEPYESMERPENF